jgi:hypothetical protein
VPTKLAAREKSALQAESHAAKAFTLCPVNSAHSFAKRHFFSNLNFLMSGPEIASLALIVQQAHAATEPGSHPRGETSDGVQRNFLDGM